MPVSLSNLTSLASHSLDLNLFEYRLPVLVTMPWDPCLHLPQTNGFITLWSCVHMI